MPDKEFPVERTATIGGVVLIDPHTKKPYKSGVTVQQVEGGFDPTGLSTEEKQDLILAAIQDLTAAFQATGPEEVNVVDDQLPPVEGQATATKQDQILSALQTLTTLAVDEATFRENGTSAVSVDSLPLPVGAASAAKQDAILAALGSLQEALAGPLDVAGTVSLDPAEVTVTGTVDVGNTSLAVTPAPGATYPVSLAGSATETKQDAILTALANLLTQAQAPQPITDNGGSVTVDGTVGISGTVASTQSGAWNVGITGTPTVNVGNPTLAVTQSGTWQIQTTPGASATSAALTSFRSGTVSTTAQTIKTSSGRVYQYTFFNPNSATVYVHLYDLATGSITAGTTTPKMSFAVPAGSTLDGYWSISHGFATAISISASNNWDGSGAPASTMQVTVGYA